MTNAIEIKGLTKKYNDFTLDNISFDLPAGCIVGLIGENGAGKTTTIKTLLGMVKADSGTATVLGTAVGHDMSAVKEDIGVVLDEPGFPSCITPRKLDRILSSAYKNWNRDEYGKLIDRLGLPWDKEYGDFSRGMKMKLGIAAAMSHGAKLLLLDEPTGGLDPVVRDVVVELFLDFTREPDHSILISSHIVSDLEKLCDYIAFIHKGRLILFREKDALMEEYCLVRCDKAALDGVSAGDIMGRRDGEFATTAIMRRRAVPEGIVVEPLNIEELFVFTVKEVDR